MTRKDQKCHLVGFIEEILDSCSDSSNESKRIPEHIEPKHEHVHLFDGLLGVVARDLSSQLGLVVETVLPLEVTQPAIKGMVEQFVGS